MSREPPAGSPTARTGVLLVNLGTPASPSRRDVRRYLREFLSDPRVIDTHPLVRAALLYLVILPFRPRTSAAAYRKIWTERGSPLLVHGRALCEGVAADLGSAFRVELAMRYGEPSIASGLAALRAAGVARLVVVPLFPQYADASSGSTLDRVRALAGGDFDPVLTCPPFYDDPGFVAAWAAVAREPLARFAPDHVLHSYHGLPERQVRAGDPSGSYCLVQEDCCQTLGPQNRNCYRAQCHATSRALARALDLAPGDWSISFQSRLGRTPWIRPYTDEVVARLAERGVRRLAVLCPAFVADCLETLEEIGIRLREQWLELGGEALVLSPCPNADPVWVRAVADMVRTRAAP